MGEGRSFAMPDVGEGLTEAEIVCWHVAVGDEVAVNDVIVEVETAKSLVELPCPFAGVVTALHAEPGQTVAVGTPIITIGGTPAPAEQAPAAEPDTPDEDRQPVLVGYGPTRAQVARRPRKPGHRPYETPPVRARARRLAASTPAAAESPVESPAETRSPVKGVRKATAAAMVASAFTAPHVTEWVTVDVTESLALLDRLRRDPEYAGKRLTPLVLIVRATLSALRAHPEMNAKWDDDRNEIIQYRDVNLGIAAATPRGLLVPNIKAAQTLGTGELCDRLADLVDDARAGRTTPEAMSKGTFTITNIGVFGVDGGTPILNPGEAGILCVGRIARRPWEHDGAVALRSVCTLSLSFDHRLIDGRLGSQVLARIGRLLEQPSLALVH